MKIINRFGWMRGFALLGFLLAPSSSSAATVMGNIDKLVPDSKGVLSIYGWACAAGRPASINVELSVTKSRVLANYPSESAVARTCRSTGNAYRFFFPLTGEIRARYAGQKIHILGIDPDGGVHPPIGGSGTFLIPADTQAPVIRSFAVPALSRTPTISPITASATDDVGVTGYLITESATKPSLSASGWTAVPPTTYTFAAAGFGARMLHLWAKDAGGNVSLSKSASVEITPIRGNVDGVQATPDGRFFIVGWACASRNPSSILVDLYLGGPWPQGTSKGRFLANRASEPAVAQACSSTGTAYRFWIPLTSEIRAEHAGAKIYIHGINPNGGANPLIGGSGVFAVPLDTRPPAISEFSLPPNSNSRTILPIRLTGTDDVQVAGFRITETAVKPSADSAGWCSSGICPYVFPSETEGRRTLYAWAKDVRGNVSESRAASVEIRPVPVLSAIVTVDPVSGDDQRGGISGTPVRTISKALQLVSPRGGQVLLKGGSYFENVKIENRDPSLPPVTISGIPGEVPVLFCSRPLADGATRKWTRLSEESDIWSISADRVISGLFHGAPAASSSFIPPARFPSEGFLSFADGSTRSVPAEGIPTQLMFNQDAVEKIHLSDLRNATIHWRRDDYRISDNIIASYNGSGKAVLAEALEYTASKDWGFYLENKLWMLTSAWHWVYEADSKLVYLRVPAGLDPNAIHVRATSHTVQGRCVEILNSANVTLSDLAIREAGPSAVLLKDSRNINLLNLRISHGGAKAIMILASAPGLNIENIKIADSTIEFTQQEAISLLQGLPGLTVNGLEVTGNVFRDIGMLGSPRQITSAVNAEIAKDFTFIGNRIQRTAYNGVNFSGGARVMNNVIESSCQWLDDCGGIYTWNGVRDAQNNPISMAPSLVENNLVFGADGTGALAGKPMTRGLFPCGGIYLDDFANNVKVIGNTLLHNERGINLNNPASQRFERNLLVSNRAAQFALNSGYLSHVKGIAVVGNQLFTTNAQAPVAIPYSAAELLNDRSKTSWDRNRYLSASRVQVQSGQAFPGFALLQGGDPANAQILKLITNPDFTSRVFSCPTIQSTCDGWKFADGNVVAFPVLVGPLEAIPLFGPSQP